MFDRIINDKYYCGLDIGARTVKAGLLKCAHNAESELVGVYEHPTHGFKDNAVSDLDEFSECIHATIARLTKKTGVKVKEVQLGLGGALVEARTTKTMIPLIDKGSKIITRRDIKKVNDHARLLGVQLEEEILHDLPQHYRIDDMNSAENPLGLYGRKLGVQSLMIVINENRIRNITRAVHQAGFEVANVSFNSYAASRVVLSDEQKNSGCALIDIGSQYTSVLIFKNGVVQFYKGINIGGHSFTNSIADQIRLPPDLAEEIKRSYAVASGYDEYQDEEILVKKEETYAPIKRGSINQAIRSDVEALAGHIRSVVSMSGTRDQLSGGVTVIGGGALLPGFIEKIAQDINLPVALGKMRLSLQKDLSHTAVFSSVVGLAQGGYERTFRFAFDPREKQHWTKNVTSRIKELYQEYF